MPRPSATGVRDRAILDVLLRSRYWEAEHDLHDTRARVNRALAADDLRERRRALLDDAAAVIAELEQLPHPDDPAYDDATEP